MKTKPLEQFHPVHPVATGVEESRTTIMINQDSLMVADEMWMTQVHGARFSAFPRERQQIRERLGRR